MTTATATVSTLRSIRTDHTDGAAIAAVGGAAAPQWRVRPVPTRTAPPLALALDPDSKDSTDPRGAIQGTFDLQIPCSRAHLRVLGDNGVEPELTPLTQLPDAEVFSARIAVTLLEVIAGRRPLTHVGRVTSPEVYASLERRRIGGRSAQSRMRPSRVRRVVGGSPREGVFDAAVVIDDQRRVRAMALRLLGVDGRWLITELRLT